MKNILLNSYFVFPFDRRASHVLSKPVPFLFCLDSAILVSSFELIKTEKLETRLLFTSSGDEELNQQR